MGTQPVKMSFFFFKFLLYYPSRCCGNWMFLQNKLDAFELWFWRKILRVSWTEGKSNKELLQKVRLEIWSETMTKMLRMRYFAYVTRAQPLEKDKMLGITTGARRKGSST